MRFMRWTLLLSLAAVAPHALAAHIADFQFSTPAELQASLSSEDISARGYAHLQLSRHFVDRDRALAAQHLTEAQANFPKQDVTGNAHLQASWCWLYTMTGGIQNAGKHCQQAIQLAQSAEEPWALSRAYGSSAVYNYQMGELSTAIEEAEGPRDLYVSFKNDGEKPVTALISIYFSNEAPLAGL